jgi:hypothetical protein
MDQATHNKIVVSSGNQVVAQLHLSEASHRLAVDRELPRPSRPETLAPGYFALSAPRHRSKRALDSHLPTSASMLSRTHCTRIERLVQSFPRSVNNGRSHPQGQSR